MNRLPDVSGTEQKGLRGTERSWITWAQKPPGEVDYPLITEIWNPAADTSTVLGQPQRFLAVFITLSSSTQDRCAAFVTPDKEDSSTDLSDESNIEACDLHLVGGPGRGQVANPLERTKKHLEDMGSTDEHLLPDSGKLPSQRALTNAIDFIRLAEVYGVPDAYHVAALPDGGIHMVWRNQSRDIDFDLEFTPNGGSVYLLIEGKIPDRKITEQLASNEFDPLYELLKSLA